MWGGVAALRGGPLGSRAGVGTGAQTDPNGGHGGARLAGRPRGSRPIRGGPQRCAATSCHARVRGPSSARIVAPPALAPALAMTWPRMPLPTVRSAVAVAWAAVAALRVVQTTAFAPLPHAADGLLTGLSVSLGLGLLVVLRRRPPRDARRRVLAALAVSVLLVLLLLATAVSAAAQNLPRRALFGAQVVPVSADVRARAGLPAEGGVLIGAVTPGGPAAAAGVRGGDVVLAIDGQPVPDPGGFVQALKRGARGAWTLTVRRGADDVQIPFPLQEAPRWTSPDYDVVYGTATTADGTRRRTIATKPHGGGPFPAVLLIGGVGCYSLDQPGGGSYAPYFDAFTLAGHVVLWVEKSGVGDSEGAPCPTIDFETELAGYRAALAALRAFPAVDADRVVIVGHSMGGLIGPLLAAEASVAGVAAISTAGLPWVEYTLANTRRQLALSGLGPAEVDAAMRDAIGATYAVYVEKRSPDDVLAEHPEWGGFLQFPQHVSYLQQVADYDPGAVWAAADAPALVVAGGADFVTDPAEHERIVAVVNQLRPGTARYVLIPDLDHFGNRVPDAQTSFRIVMTRGEAPANDDLPRRLVEWADRLPTSR